MAFGFSSHIDFQETTNHDLIYYAHMLFSAPIGERVWKPHALVIRTRHKFLYDSFGVPYMLFHWEPLTH